ncbi:MAG: DNA-binding response regulator [Sphingomonas bacterium]|nr:response regulator [Sphingomonas bacterium]MDB5690830.1 DNA-binding response regulator [Sphingomonas bacterium]
MSEARAARILVVDDDADLRGLIADFLAANGLEVRTAGNGSEMDAALAQEPVDLIVLDLMMPGEDGLAIVRRLRGADRPPVIMLSAMGEDTDRIVGLEVGADDYLAKPCNPRELLARIRAVLRRGDAGAVPEAQGNIRRFGPWALDVVERQVRRDGAGVVLTDGEFRILSALLDRPRRVVSRDQLIEATRGSDSEVFDRAIDVTISRLRKKLGPGDPIRTVRNEGYRLDLQADRP